MTKPLISIQQLTKQYKNINAVDALSFDIFPGETLGLVGESGCGKSTTGRMLIGLEDPSSGSITYQGEDLQKLIAKNHKALRKKLQIIFQDPYSSLNPRMTLGEILKEPLVIHGITSKEKRKAKIESLLNLVHLDGSFASRYPHEISGGQRQRIGIARALAVNPKFIVCDEPISALDVSIQAQIVNLLKKFQEEFGLTYLFISHDLSMVKYLSHRIAVMYLGHLVELAPANELYENPLHPYTQTLLAAIFLPDPIKEQRRQHISISQDPFSHGQHKKGCPFAHRCSKVQPICHHKRPECKEIATNHYVSCHLY
jgi:oligopeptide/dipeptide ABC transporter ATP-binding protein